MSYTRRYFRAEVPITTPNIAPDAVTQDKIADDAITSAKIKDRQVQSDDIALGAIKPEHLSPEIPAVGIGEGAVTSTKLMDASVIAAKIAPAAITSEKIGMSQITESKLLDQAVSTDKIKNGNVTRQKLANCSVGPDQIDDGGVTKPKIAENSVGPGKLECVDAPAHGEVPTYDSGSEKFEWKPLVPPLINFHDPVMVFWDDSDDEIDLDINVSAYCPDGTRGILLELIHENTSGAYMGNHASATIKDSKPASVLQTALAPEWHPGAKTKNNGIVRLFQTSPGRKSHITIARNGIRTGVTVNLQGYVT